MLKIGLCQRFFTEDGKGGGLASLYTNLAKALYGLGNEVVLITSSSSYCSDLANCCEIIYLSDKGWDDDRYSYEVREILSRLRVDIVETSNWKAELYHYSEIPIGRRVPLVIRAEIPGEMIGLDPRRSLIESTLMRRADAIIAISTYVSGVLNDQKGIEVNSIIPNGVDCKVFTYNENHNVRFGKVIWVGNYMPIKRAEWLITIARQTPTLNYDVILPIAKDNAVLAELKRMPNVSLYHGMTKQQLADHFSRASVCISTSKRESFGLSLLESMACGTPLLLPSDLDGPSDFFRSGLDGLRYNTLTEATHLLLYSDWTKYRVAAATRAREFSWVACAVKTERIYQTTVLDT